MKKQRVGRFNEEEMAAKESEQVARDAKEEAAASAIPVGSRCQVQVPGQPTKIGAVMYVGKWSVVTQLWAQRLRRVGGCGVEDLLHLHSGPLADAFIQSVLQ